MKYKFFKSLLILGLVSGMAYSLNGCKKNDGIVITNTAALFADAAEEGSYFIPDDPGTVFKIPVGITAAAGKDVTFQFTVTSPSGAVEGQQYTLASKSITIPAGKTVDSISLKGIFDAYDGGRKDTLIFKITSGGVPVVSGSGEYTVILQQFCPLVMSEFAGDFKVLVDEWEDYPPGTTIPLTVSGNKVSFYYNVAPDANMKPIEIAIDPVTFETSVAPQTYGDYGSATIYSVKSVASDDNVAVPCDKKITVVLNHTGSNGFSGNFMIRLQKQ
ncbi:hypothetical protein HB364_02925 [Pseudoflavitalea sp. X16]|uniref:hypothetical protein n=1 Tax=Paraflavitalea devenefica TaxID=2716334 RepID=UPI001420A15D|nr:hypothetical protein [Paraflavitalea devenefica]NII24018.1 hypothetical protein [Paraflavitalea devenefica]